ncbi:hypothetical protein MTO96_040007 [Rhipicephalus appendiculatus]
MAVSANEVTVRLSMNEEFPDLVQRLDGLNPHAISELVLSNCVGGDPTKLCAQIRRCVGLRRLCCVACVLQPRHLLQLMFDDLQHLERIEFSLVEMVKEAVDIEIKHVSRIASQERACPVAHSLRQVYVEVGGYRSFELLWELLKFWPKVADLHVHLSRGTFLDAPTLSECRRLQEELHHLETFTVTSELQAFTSYPDKPDPSSVFMNCATICANVRHNRSDDSWSCVELVYPRVGSLYRRYLCLFFITLDHIAELNMNSFHVNHGMDMTILLDQKPFRDHLKALSAPPCWFARKSFIHLLPIRVPNLQDLDVRIVRRGMHFRCRSCEQDNNIEAALAPFAATASSFVENAIARLTLCDVSSDVLLKFVEFYGAAVTLRLAQWSFVKNHQYNHLCKLLGENSAIRCLVLATSRTAHQR